ncbi:MAG: hypothetical protein CVV21_00840 [Candidatus Goldiibacteriota bacterium HGW-Goldbacteria-1]|jgi:TolA-binding protein|nr:MAG: hypothetical protein CVV21_00840 [Candidatus Goldiibacteriota bacterium HGW-Goldbacteria-1]
MKAVNLKKLLLTCVFISAVCTQIPAYTSAEQEEYDFAYSLFLNNNFSIAENLLKNFIVNRPEAALAGSAYFVRAEAFYKKGEYSKALSAYMSIPQKYPQDVNKFRKELYYRMAECYFNLKDYQSAAKYSEIVLKEYPDSYIAKDACLLAAENLFLSGDYDGALSYLGRLEKYSDYANFDYAYYMTGRVYYEKSLAANGDEKKRMAKESLRFFDRVKNEYPGSEIINHSEFRRANTLYSLEQYKDAVKICDVLLEKNVNDNKFKAMVEYFRAWNYFMLSYYDRAFSAFNSIIKNYPGDMLSIWSEYKKGLCYEAKNDSKAAMEQYQKVMTDYPDTLPAAYSEYAMAYLNQKQGEYYGALNLYGGIISKYSIEELTRASYFMTAEIYTKMDRFAEAAQTYSVIENKYPEDANIARFMKAWCDSNNGNRDSAQAAYNGILSDDKAERGLKAKSTVKLGDIFFEKENPVEAARYYKKAIDEFDDVSGIKAEARYGLGWIHYAANRFDSARLEFDGAAKEAAFAGDAELKTRALFMSANSLYGAYEFDRAYGIYSSILSSKDAPAEIKQEALFYAAFCRYRKEDFDTAASMWRDYLNKTTDRVKKAEAYFRIGWAYFRKNDFDAAVKNFDEIIKNYGDTHLNQEALLKKGDSFYNKAEYAQAVVSYRELVEKYPEHYRVPEALYGIQWSYYQLGDTEKAVEVSRQFLEKYSGSSYAPEIMYRVAEHYYNSSKYETAVSEFAKFTSKHPSHELADNAWYFSGVSNYYLRNYQMSINDFRTIINKFPDSAFVDKALFRTANSYYKLHDYKSAAENYVLFINKYPNSENSCESHFNAAMSYKRTDDMDNAVKMYLAIIDTMPGCKLHERAHMNLAYLYQDIKKYEEAINIFEKLSAAKGKKAAEAQFWIGDIYQAQGKDNEAAAAFNKVYDNFPQDEEWFVPALDGAGKIYEKQGNLKAAISAYKKIVKSAKDVKYTSVAKKRAELLEEQYKLMNPAPAVKPTVKPSGVTQ